MIDRYQNNLIRDNTKGIPYYLSALPAEIPTEVVPFYYVTRQGDRLDNIANTFYKNPSMWWVIAKANNLVNGSIAISAGTRLYIPNI
jgi:nucleoid-associated protein YgaU